MRTLFASLVLATLIGVPASAQESATQEENCELHIWAVAYVPPAQAAAQSNAMVKVTPPNFADPHSSGSLLDARQRLPEIDAPTLLEQFGLEPDYKVIIHPEGFVPPKTFKNATSRLSESASECYIDFALYGRTHTAGKASFSYDYFFRDFGNDQIEDLYVKGGTFGVLIRYGEEEKGINTKAATADLIMNAGRKIERRRRRQR